MSQESVVSPLAGTVINMSEVPDPVFAREAMGVGFGVADTPGGPVLSPVTGKVVMVAKTGHAVGIATESGLQYLVHLGIDTVELEGRPFTVDVAKGDQVEAGQQIATMDVEAVTSAGKDTTTVVVITNSKKKVDSIDVTVGEAQGGDTVAEVTLVAEGANDAEDAETAEKPVAASVGGATGAASGSGAEAGPSTAEQRPADLTGHDATAWDIIHNIGGAENVRSVTHCITRLRFYLKDQDIADDETVADLDGVIDVVKAAGQYQVVIGADVEDVYAATEAQLGMGDGADGADGDGASADVEERERPTTVIGWAKYGFSELIGVITGSMIPVIGLLAAAGVIKGILSLLLAFDLVTEETPTYQIIEAMSDAVFFFLPIFVGFTAARRLGSDPIIVAIIGGVLCYPTLLDISETEGDKELLGMTLNADFFGIPIHIPSYSASIFPIIVAAWLAARIEPWLKRVVPNVVRMIFVPLLEVVIVSLAILLILGPVVMFISTGIANGIQSFYDLSPIISGTVIGGFYQSLVIFGLHWAVIPLVAQDIASVGSSNLNAIISATMVAQGGAALAILFKTKIEKIKGLSGPAAISAFCGITEPAMYGLNLKYGRVFIMASVGGAVGGLLTGLFNVNMWGFTGAFVGFTSFVNPDDGIDGSFWGFLIASFAALAVSFVLTWFFGFKDSDVENSREVKKVRLGRREPTASK
ncbi:MAG TPA: glucose PTS transporter subunit IIA [Candidatus Corynebacterium avicola]|uniref:Glucose PTS transporter subunit IIA n=1 Tax=Candidatus Corynebacterium avicola TaxID=2838527 RepID=A0A9D1RRG8_9CORY|nr:glucose PTS transporter subunit IIA [Candidatus Corynebacterium avicola]